MVERASMRCARVILGTISIAKEVIFLSAIFLRISAFEKGLRNPKNIVPSFMPLTSSMEGLFTFKTISASDKRAPTFRTILAPADSNSLSSIKDLFPAPDSTNTSVPALAILEIVSGTAATRRSFREVSFRIPTFILAPFVGLPASPPLLRVDAQKCSSARKDKDLSRGVLSCTFRLKSEVLTLYEPLHLPSAQRVPRIFQRQLK